MLILGFQSIFSTPVFIEKVILSLLLALWDSVDPGCPQRPKKLPVLLAAKAAPRAKWDFLFLIFGLCQSLTPGPGRADVVVNFKSALTEGSPGAGILLEPLRQVRWVWLPDQFPALQYYYLLIPRLFFMSLILDWHFCWKKKQNLPQAHVILQLLVCNTPEKSP